MNRKDIEMYMKRTEIGMLNVLAEARYDMPLVSQKLFISVLAQVDINKKNFDSINIGLVEFAKNNNISKKYMYNKKEFITSKALTAQILIKDVDSDRYKQIPIFGQAEYNSGIFTFRFNDLMKPYLLDIYSKGNYFKFVKEYISKFTCKYTMKLYLLCQSNLWKHHVIYPINYIKDFYDIDKNKYKEFRNLKERVLNPALQEINEKTNLNVKMESIKIGRKIEKLEFIITDKKQIENVDYIISNQYFNNFCDFINYNIDDDKMIQNRIELFESWQNQYSLYLIFFVGEKAKKFATKNIFSYIDTSLKTYPINKEKNIFFELWGKEHFDDLEYIKENSSSSAFNDFKYIEFFEKYKSFDINKDIEELYLDFRKSLFNNLKEADEFVRIDLDVRMFTEDEKITNIYEVEDTFIKNNNLFSDEFIDLYLDKIVKVKKIKDFIKEKDEELLKFKIDFYQCENINEVYSEIIK